ncbi:MAG TPA: hypothetical protein VGC58_03075 [Candidatus Paceibacterota bacterium]
MFNISKFLDKFSKNLQSEESYKEAVKNILKNQIGLEIDFSKIEIKNNVVYIKSTPGVLNKIFINKQSLLGEISKSLPMKIVDIK